MLHPSSLVALLAHRAESTPDRLAFEFIDGHGRPFASLDYATLHHRSRALAAALRALGLGYEPVLLFTGSPESFLVSFLGINQAGAIAVPLPPLHPRHGRDRIQAVIADTGARFALVPGDQTGRLCVDKLLDGANLRIFTVETLELQGQGIPFKSSTGGADALALLQYTSGSTSNPKGVCISHMNLLSNVAGISQAMNLGPDSILVSWLPLYHDMGLMTGLVAPLYSGCPVSLMTPSTFAARPVTWLSTLTRRQATVTGAPNFALDHCVRQIDDQALEALDLSSLQVMFCGSEAVRADTLERFADRYAACGFSASAFLPCYGLAEATLMVSGGPMASGVRRFESRPGAGDGVRVGCGRPLKDLEVVIVDPDCCRRCNVGAVGEVWVRGSSVAAGYWRRGRQEGAFDGWLAGDSNAPFLRTGDLGYFDGDEVVICGRIKELLVICGVNHHPQDIEATSSCSHPALGSCAAAVAIEDESGEGLLIVQELRREWRGDPSPALQSIFHQIADRHGVRPIAIGLVSHAAILRTTSGKIRRAATRAAFMAGELKVLARFSTAPPACGNPLTCTFHKERA